MSLPIFPLIPFKKERTKENFEQLPLYIEEHIPIKEEIDKNQKEDNIIIIEFF